MATTVEQEKTFAAALDFLRIEEGGVSDRLPEDDPGGLTNFGITQVLLSNYRARFPGEDMPSSVLVLTLVQAQRIYRKMFWEPCWCSELPAPVALIVFNAAVQSGQARAVRWLQQALINTGITVRLDGSMGPKTIAAAGAADSGLLIAEALTDQLLFEVALNNWKVNRHGWVHRLFRACWTSRGL